MNGGGSVSGLHRQAGSLGWLRLMFAVSVNQFDEIGRQLGKIGQRFVDHPPFGRRGASGGTPGPPLGRHALALDQENGLIAFAAEPGAIALNEHDNGSLSGNEMGGKYYI